MDEDFEARLAAARAMWPEQAKQVDEARARLDRIGDMDAFVDWWDSRICLVVYADVHAKPHR